MTKKQTTAAPVNIAPVNAEPGSADAFARALYGQLASGNENVVVSPTSVEAALLLALAGARGQTATQIAHGLQLPTGDLDVGHRLDALLAGAGDTARSSDLLVANSAWIQAGFPTEQAYLHLLETNGRASVNTVDFEHASEAARAAINAWVAEHTANKIEELLQRGMLDSQSRLVLANAVYFKRNWATPFSAGATKDEPFLRPDQPPLSVPLMHLIDTTPFSETETYQVLELPYEGNEASLVVWLPKQAENLATMERQLAADGLDASLQGLVRQEVDISLPKFKVRRALSLIPALQALGMKDAFGPLADFSGISATPLYVSAVVHEAVVEVDEKGTEAAAATGVIGRAMAMPHPPREKIVFRADHPFLFAIRHRQSGALWFLGRLTNPGE